MPLRAPGKPPVTQRDWDEFCRAAEVTPDTNSVTTDRVANKAITNAKLRDSAATSVIGRAGAGAGPPADIAAGLDDTFLRRRSGALGFGGLVDSDIPATLARDSEVSTGDAVNAAALATHAGAADPHPGYVLESTILNGSATYDPPNLADGAGTSTTVGVTGAAMGDFAWASFSLDVQNVLMRADVTAADTVTVRLQNESGGAVNLASGTLAVRVFK